MIVYHGSNQEIRAPKIVNRFITLDFGVGFYTTTNQLQAENFARKVVERRKESGFRPTVSKFEISDLKLISLNVKRFNEPNEGWLDFVVHNRKYGRSKADSSDVIMGPVANDDVFTTITLFEAGQLNESEAIARFKVKKLYNQVLFCSDKALRKLEFIESYEVAYE